MTTRVEKPGKDDWVGGRVLSWGTLGLQGVYRSDDVYGKRFGELDLVSIANVLNMFI